jgi:2,3-bisphosphoglycerate-dependent phosphoglycerate mutase
MITELNTFYLIRHAHADWTPDENRPLSASGEREAVRVAEVLSQYPIDAIYSSPYRRAIQTVEPLAARLDIPVQITPELRERELGYSVTGDFYNAVQSTWCDPTFTYPGGESNAAAQQRGVSLINQLQQQYPGANIALSTHGNLMALLMKHFNPEIDFSFWQSLTMPDVYNLDIQQDGSAQMDRLWRDKDT